MRRISLSALVACSLLIMSAQVASAKTISISGPNFHVTLNVPAGTKSSDVGFDSFGLREPGNPPLSLGGATLAGHWTPMTALTFFGPIHDKRFVGDGIACGLNSSNTGGDDVWNCAKRVYGGVLVLNAFYARPKTEQKMISALRDVTGVITK